MTPRELRSILFQIRNEDLTIKELRTRLFEIDAYDSEINDCSAAWIAIGDATSPFSPDDCIKK